LQCRRGESKGQGDPTTEHESPEEK